MQRRLSSRFKSQSIIAIVVIWNEKPLRFLRCQQAITFKSLGSLCKRRKTCFPRRRPIAYRNRSEPSHLLHNGLIELTSVRRNGESCQSLIKLCIFKQTQWIDTKQCKAKFPGRLVPCRTWQFERPTPDDDDARRTTREWDETLREIEIGGNK